MRIRLNGTREEIAVWVDVLRRSFDVHEASAFTPWTRRDPLSKVGAVYVTVELLPDDAQRVVQAKATRLDRAEVARRGRRELH